MNKRQKQEYYFQNGAFIIENYDLQKPFSSFLPAIAGKKGIPLWSYYCNRAQGIASFGLGNKDGAILEFSPANTAYRVVDKLGFRTFIKEEGNVYEIFSPNEADKEYVKRKMMIESNKFSIIEENEKLSLCVKVTYFGLPNENIGGLVRRVTITNLLSKPRKIEVVDGLTQIIPPGVGEWSMKHQSNLIKSWMDVDVLENKIAFYKTNSAPGDEAEVREVYSGNFYFSYLNSNKEIIYPVYDANVVFGFDTTLSKPLMFINNSVEELMKIKQVAANKVPVGFSVIEINLQKEETINTIIGFTYNKEMIINKIEAILEDNYFNKKEKEANLVTDMFLDDCYVKTNYPIFDAYIKQNYLDNILRGGYPMIIDTKSNKFIYHLYSRRHGDMEREYNYFSIAPEYYSQGNGNFRDVCQNRRSDNLFYKDIKMYNAKVFASLIQLDGYNPLQVQGSMFHLKNKEKAKELANLFDNKQKIIENILLGHFTPGIIMNVMETESITTKYKDDELFSLIFEEAEQEINALFGEGYWSDHWTYIFDLVENAIAIYPEEKDMYLFDDCSYRYFESPATVLPRIQKYVITPQGKIRQYGAIIEHDEKKIQKLHLEENISNWAKDNNNNLLLTNLFGKLLSLCTMKFTSLDSIGVGIEMEGNKPGWNDAMNGLPGLFGSGVSETIELARIVTFLLKSNKSKETYLPIELIELINKVMNIYAKYNYEYSFNLWDEVTTAKEDYREKIRFEHLGMKKVSTIDYQPFLSLMKKVLDKGIYKAFEIGKGIIPTFIVFEVKKYEKTDIIGNYNLPTVIVKEFSYRALPYFLEAPARVLKYLEDEQIITKMVEEIKNTELFDKKFKTYKTSVSLENEGYEIGRVRAFQSGWLERESNFLHMTYKYLLGLLKAKQYNKFYHEIKTNFVCFMDPTIYGRSTLENSSFIAPSNNPDPLVQGQGFVSRLSGSTAEMLSIYQIMMFGYSPFVFDEEKKVLICEFKPILKDEFFNEEGQVSALFLSKIMVKYINKNRKDIFNLKPTKYRLISDEIVKEVNTIEGLDAIAVRDFKYKEIEVYFE